jgi:hypothetical protein
VVACGGAVDLPREAFGNAYTASDQRLVIPIAVALEVDPSPGPLHHHAAIADEDAG